MTANFGLPGGALRALPSEAGLEAGGDGWRAPEQLVGFGFRGWIAGYQTGNIGCWERVWQVYSNALGPRAAKVVVGELSVWAKAVKAGARRKVEVGPIEACNFCRDECLAISMIAASQHRTCPAMRACAFALIESSLIEEVVHHSDSFAITMRSLDQVISPNWIVNANALVDPCAQHPH
ncbi:conserved protein of unknown function [Candidatus Filomicrobium marinum]|uniref:Uncharacterized protein n=2 Tax=Filomicrobium TaxID=119044 RepID=A0A0D6JFL3_9HYPH|nr:MULTISPECIES: hypothetical protein [Filomicrobium]MCV0370122.1 hypothetical protein [Filomicrobium sp.]CFX25967.1 conserved protein of unknown function [Candidatus Filomicrobium marinum]CPR19371.1 conserved protein of unknown function [Candidatus Filomicrobium marinum]SDO07997.1 hypothetical protein SAMN04488061_0203 [Filomicrobium insigne]